MTLDGDGDTKVGELRYQPYGSVRYTWGATPTDFRFTGQRYEGAGAYLYDYGARWYKPWIGRFVQPDTIVPEPGNPQTLNRYAYALNNPLKYNDPTGHLPCPTWPNCQPVTPPLLIKPDSGPSLPYSGSVTLTAKIDVPQVSDFYSDDPSSYTPQLDFETFAQNPAAAIPVVIDQAVQWARPYVSLEPQPARPNVFVTADHTYRDDGFTIGPVDVHNESSSLVYVERYQIGTPLDNKAGVVRQPAIRPGETSTITPALDYDRRVWPNNIEIAITVDMRPVADPPVPITLKIDVPGLNTGRAFPPSSCGILP